MLYNITCILINSLFSIYKLHFRVIHLSIAIYAVRKVFQMCLYFTTAVSLELATRFVYMPTEPLRFVLIIDGLYSISCISWSFSFAFYYFWGMKRFIKGLKDSTLTVLYHQCLPPNIHLRPIFVFVRSEGFGETARLRNVFSNVYKLHTYSSMFHAYQPAQLQIITNCQNYLRKDINHYYLYVYSFPSQFYPTAFINIQVLSC